MTNQEFFTKSLLHIMKQKRPCTDDGGNCVFAGPGREACAVGVFLPRRLAKQLDEEGFGQIGNFFDTSLPESHIPPARELKKIFSGVDVHLLSKMQKLHDEQAERTQSDLDEIWSKAKEIADGHGCEMPRRPRATKK